MYRGLQASAAYHGFCPEGNSTDRYVRNVSKQMGDYKALQKRQRRHGRERQYSRQQLGQIVKYLNQYNSQQFYKKAPIKKPDDAVRAAAGNDHATAAIYAGLSASRYKVLG